MGEDIWTKINKNKVPTKKVSDLLEARFREVMKTAKKADQRPKSNPPLLRCIQDNNKLEENDDKNKDQNPEQSMDQ